MKEISLTSGAILVKAPVGLETISDIEITMPDYNINQVNIIIDFGLSFEPDRFGTVSVSFDQFESAINE